MSRIEALDVELAAGSAPPRRVSGLLRATCCALGLLLTPAADPPRPALAAPASSLVYLPLAVRGSAPPPPPVAVTPTPAPPMPSPVPDKSAALFDPDAIIDVRIAIDPYDWDALRVQSRTMAELFGDEECLSEPHVSPFTYYPADIWVNGELIRNVGVRKKGLLGSISSTKPSLKISFDEYAGGQRFAGLNRLTLNNAQQDPSYVRQCITYELFAQAGLPAPRCNYARVTLNGRKLGIYVNVESIKKPVLDRWFGDDSGNLYEGTLSDFTADWAKTFERKTNEAGDDRSDLEALIAALGVEDPGLLEALDPVLDVDAFLDFWAMEVLTGHWDGYASNRNNFFIYGDPTSGRFAFIPWGTDAALSANPRSAPDGGPPPASVAATAELPRRLYMNPVGRERYAAHLVALLDDVWREDRILGAIDRTVALIEPELDEGAVVDFASEVESVRSFVQSRRTAIQAELQGGPPAYDFPPSGAPCRQVVGHFKGSFIVRWEQPGVITATASVQLAGSEPGLVQVAAAAGVAGDDPWPVHAEIQMAGLAAEDTPPIWRQGDAFLGLLFVDPARFGPDRVLPIDGRNAFGWAVLAKLQDDGSREVAFLGMLWDGELTLADAGAVPGDLVSGTIDADVVVWGGL